MLSFQTSRSGELMTIIESNKYNLAEQIENIISNSDSGEVIKIKLIEGDQSQVYAISKGIDTEQPICNNGSK